MKFDHLLKRIAKMEPSPPTSSISGLESLSDAEIDARLESLIRRLEHRGTPLDCLHKELTCVGCAGNNSAAWCYAWKGDELQVCSPKAAGHIPAIS